MICIPKISMFQFHPFSLSTSPHQDAVSLHVRSLGNWTTALANLADKQREIEILIEGPYGNLSIDLESDTRYKMILLISGGIGITPLQ
jgi:predicted ferric reductase